MEIWEAVDMGGGSSMKIWEAFPIHDTPCPMPHTETSLANLTTESQKSILDVFPLRAAFAENSHAWPKIGSQRPQSQFHPIFSCFSVFSLLESAEVPFRFLVDQEAQLLQLPDRSSPKPASLLVRSRNCSCWSLQSTKRAEKQLYQMFAFKHGSGKQILLKKQ